MLALHDVVSGLANLGEVRISNGNFLLSCQEVCTLGRNERSRRDHDHPCALSNVASDFSVRIQVYVLPAGLAERWPRGESGADDDAAPT